MRTLILTTFILCLGTIQAVFAQTEGNSAAFLTNEEDVINMRMQMIRNETEEIFSIFYLWDGNKIGSAALAEHREAALRGVKVRIIIDGLSALPTSSMPKSVQRALEPVAPSANITKEMMRSLEEAGVEIRVFNPVTRSSMTFPRINTRTHDKISFFKSQNTAMIGDRNWQNINFRLATKKPGQSYRSIEAAFRGPEVADVDSYLNSLWENKEWVKAFDTSNVDANIVKTESRKFDRLMKTIKETFRIANLTNALKPVKSADFQHDTAGLKRKVPGMEPALLKVLGSANKSVVVLSPYIVLTEDFEAKFNELIERNVAVTIIIPSYESTDSPAASAAFEKQARALSAKGVKILKHQGPDFMHSKMILVDEVTTVVMTHNLDFISQYLNYESGIIIEDEEFAKNAVRYIEELKLESKPFAAQKFSFMNRCVGYLIRKVTENPPFKNPMKVIAPLTK